MHTFTRGCCRCSKLVLRLPERSEREMKIRTAPRLKTRMHGGVGHSVRPNGGDRKSPALPTQQAAEVIAGLCYASDRRGR